MSPGREAPQPAPPPVALQRPPAATRAARRSQARATTPCSAGSPVPGSGHRPSLQSWAGPGSHLPVGLASPLAVPDAATVGASGSARKRARPAPPLPERSASRGDVRAPPPAARLLGRAANSSSWDTGVGCGGVWSVCPSRWRPPGSGRCTSLRPFPGASLATLISPSLLAAESTSAAGRSPTPPSRLCTAPGSPLECPSRWSSCLPAPQSGLPGIVGTRLAPGPLAWTRAQTDNGGTPEDGVRWLLVAVGVRGAPRALGF